MTLKILVRETKQGLYDIIMVEKGEVIKYQVWMKGFEQRQTAEIYANSQQRHIDTYKLKLKDM